ncbi:hypothetical protein ACWDZ4_20970 [Streptomyces sp. NPDC003016]
MRNAIQMVTPDLDSADDYRNTLLGIARTLTFTDPSRATADGRGREPEAPTGAAAMRNDFGQHRPGWVGHRSTVNGQRAAVVGQ